ncbi:hypothetical protein ACFFGT_26625 [Mucilaginibacter angelicae]|uniref:Uncharacterized protein n=1 Tax=Mucilaginibacter angelicae TaxID=869718 RepID=A0ABV6LEE1_9SPHI
MKKAIVVFILLLICPVAIFAQITLDIKHKKVNELVKLETANKSIPFKIETQYLIGRNVAQPIVYRRKEKDRKLPDLLVYYFPLKTDSSIYEVLYEWDETNFTHQASKHSVDSLQSFIKKYQELLALVKKQFGEGTTTGSLNDLAQTDSGKFDRKDNFSRDSVEVEMYVTLSNKYLKQGNVTITPTQRIRLYVKNSNTNEGSPKLDKQKVIEADKKVKLFLTALAAGNFDEARKYIAKQIASQVTNEQLTALQKEVKDDKWELSTTGVQLTLGNTIWGNLRYRRTDDKAQPPTEILSITIDENYEIMGMRPLKLK